MDKDETINIRVSYKTKYKLIKMAKIGNLRNELDGVTDIEFNDTLKTIVG